jgi:hypothetical protein
MSLLEAGPKPKTRNHAEIYPRIAGCKNGVWPLTGLLAANTNFSGDYLILILVNCKGMIVDYCVMKGGYFYEWILWNSKRLLPIAMPGGDAYWGFFSD